MDLYYLLGSPPCHAVLVTAKAIGVDFNPKVVDYAGGEHLKPAYLKMNPQHTVPTLMDNGFPLWESRAIMVYLTEKYAKDDSLYPKCVEKRALINQRLYFDMTLYQHLASYYYPPVIEKSAPNPEKLEKIKGSMASLNTFLEGQQYAVGESLTLADIALGVTVSCLDSLGFDISKYPNVQKWYKHIQEVTPGYDQNLQGLAVFKKYFNPN